ILALTILYEIHDISRFPGSAVCLLLPSGEVQPSIRREELWILRQKDWQRSPQVGLLGSGGPVFPQQPGRAETAGSSGTQTWKSQSAHHSGSQAGTRRLFHLTKGESL